MKLSRYIAKLQELQAEHGDLDVETLAVNTFGRRPAWEPRLSYKLLSKPRDRHRFIGFWFEYHGEERKGDKVVRV